MMIPGLTMRAGQNAAAITANSAAIADVFPGKVDMASDDIAAAEVAIAAAAAAAASSANSPDFIPW